ncbi:Gfo/Idh/MocA family protein [Halosimplex halophilum]|uniref:Gfo/Idh/MocA family protein n=1 Tax=Halosimplex halophilum TaxID=2559572 RepID=UPI00143547D1|nr:Gfo/Idh/MocA family oxidoreductase [Halosimplex halophilum]
MSIAVGLVGAGGVGETHAENLVGSERAALEAVCDLDGETARAVAEAADARAYTDAAELFADADLDAVYIATPPRTHAALVREATARGLAVFCEKPLAASVEDGREIVRAVDEAGVPFMTGFCLRFAEPCLRLRDLVAGGALGEPVTLFSARSGSGVPSAGNWRVDPEQACGVTVESASHNLDLLRWLGGAVAGAGGATANVSHPEIDGFDDNVVATLSFESGAVGCVRNSWTSPVETLRHGVIGTEGAAVLEGDGWWRHDRLTYRTDGDRHATTVAFDDGTATDTGYRGETRAFLDAVAADADPPVDARDGLRALELSHQILSG